MYKSTLVASLAVLAAALPSDKRAVKVTAYDANFDDLGFSPAATNSIGNYDGLNYQGIDVVTLGANGKVVVGVIPESPPNAAAYGATTIATQGQPMLLTSGTKTNFFDFEQFYFGCVVGTVESFASPPVACTITVNGYRLGRQVAQQSFSYNPGPGRKAAMEQADLGLAFKAIDKATFSTSYSVGSAGATLLDNLSYVTVGTN